VGSYYQIAPRLQVEQKLSEFLVLDGTRYLKLRAVANVTNLSDQPRILSYVFSLAPRRTTVLFEFPVLAD